jgi:hypothetical protein
MPSTRNRPAPSADDAVLPDGSFANSRPVDAEPIPLPENQQTGNVTAQTSESPDREPSTEGVSPPVLAEGAAPSGDLAVREENARLRGKKSRRLRFS